MQLGKFGKRFFLLFTELRNSIVLALYEMRIHAVIRVLQLIVLTLPNQEFALDIGEFVLKDLAI